MEQCNLIHSRIGKYRVDPLTESERSQIIDQVYYTAETMLASIKELQSEEAQENDVNMMDDVSESSLNKVKKKKSFLIVPWTHDNYLDQ